MDIRTCAAELIGRFWLTFAQALARFSSCALPLRSTLYIRRGAERFCCEIARNSGSDANLVTLIWLKGAVTGTESEWP